MSQEPEPQASPPAASPSWSEVWISALTKPSVATYEGIVNDPEASPSRGYTWVLIAALIASAVSVVFNMILAGITGPDTSGASGLGAFAGSSIGLLLCLVPFAAVMSLIGLVISAGITQFFASALGGIGSYSKLVYAFAAYSAPLSLVTGVLGAIPLINCLTIPTGLYGLALNVIANKAVNQFSWGRAIVSSVIFIAAILVFVAVLVIIGLALLGPVIGDIFSDIVQNI